MINSNPGRLGFSRANAAVRRMSFTSSVWALPKNELFEPNRFGFCFEGSYVTSTSRIVLYSGFKVVIQYCSACDKSAGLTSIIINEKAPITSFKIALLSKEELRVRSRYAF